MTRSHPSAPGSDGIGTVGRAAWAAAGGDPAALDRVASMTPPATLPSRLPVTQLAFDAVALAILAVHEALLARGMVADLPKVTVRGDRLVTSVRSERFLRIGGAAPGAWSPLSGFFPAADGWVRTHGNYPHHAGRLRAVLGTSPDAGRHTVAAAIATGPAQQWEDAAADAGAVLVRVRTAQEWAEHPQGRALVSLPMLSVARSGLGGARGWSARPVRPLEGVRVLDLTRVIAGPVAARDLAFAGADVLRVDAPWLPEIGWQHLDTGQGKRSTLLNLRDRSDRAVFERLLGDADVVLTGYRRGSLDRFGLSAAALAARHPGIVVGSVSAWGSVGPWAERRGFDSIVQAATGIAMVESGGAGTPGALPAQVLDHASGHLLAAGVIRALVDQRARAGSAAVSVALARVAQALRAGGAASDSGEESPTPPALQTGATTSGAELVTAAPVLTYLGAPEAYPAMGGGWGADDPAWRA